MAGKPTSRSASTDTKLVRELADILNDTDLTEIEMKKGDLKIRVSRGSNTVFAAAPAPMASAPVAAPAAVAAVAATLNAAEVRHLGLEPHVERE